MFCCLFWFLTKKRGFSGLLKNLKSLSRIKFFFVSFRAAQMRAKPFTRRCEPTRVVQNRIQNVVFREKPPATRPSRLRARGTGVAIRAHTFRLVYKKKREEREKKKGRLKERTASVTTAVLFWGVGIARVDGDATLESPRAPREDKESAVKDWNNADIFLLAHDVRQSAFGWWWSRVLVRDFVFLCGQIQWNGILVASQKEKVKREKKKGKKRTKNDE